MSDLSSKCIFLMMVRKNKTVSLNLVQSAVLVKHGAFYGVFSS